MIGNNKKESSVCSHTVVEKGGKKKERRNVWWHSHNLYVLFGEERKKVLTHSFEEILDAVGYVPGFFELFIPVSAKFQNKVLFALKRPGADKNGIFIICMEENKFGLFKYIFFF